MTNAENSRLDGLEELYVGIAWCLAWGGDRQPQFDLAVLRQMRDALLKDGQEVPEETRAIVEQVKQLQNIPKAEEWFPKTLEDLRQKYPELWEENTRIGLVYGGATKIKGYVFEAANLQDIRGASALLDQINLVDLPGFFGKKPSPKISRWLAENFPALTDALIPELIIYSTGGNILAFCPAALVDEVSNAIEKRYTSETLTANSCAVGDTFRLLEIRFGLLQETIENTPWLDWYSKEHQNPIVQAYFGCPQNQREIEEAFQNRKSFNELVGKLAAQFNQRRNGNDLPESDRPSRRYPPMFETHPYLVRDESDRRSAVTRVRLPKEPWFSDTLARKRLVGQKAKRESAIGQQWYKNPAFRWQDGQIEKWWSSGKLESWVLKFEQFLRETKDPHGYNQNGQAKFREAQTLEDIGNSSNGYVAFIYADGNNMGGYIQKIQTPQQYKQFSEDIDCATTTSVYKALAQHLKPHRLKGLTDPEDRHRNGTLIHPFEILAIGGDDVLLIVPANKALAIAKTIGDEFENYLVKTGRYSIKENHSTQAAHRYQKEQAPESRCQLSMSIGVLIASYNTPIYYAKNLYEQLLKSAKKRAKELKSEPHYYYGGTVDFLVMKSVTMISSKLEEFRKGGLTKKKDNGQELKLYAAPYTLHELGGLLETAKALKESGFPRPQLYQIRSLLEQGKHTAINNYRYFRVRLDEKAQEWLTEKFEKAWCQAKTNGGNLAPWMSVEPSRDEKTPETKFTSDEKTPETKFTNYETIWRELVDLYPFIEVERKTPAQESLPRGLAHD